MKSSSGSLLVVVLVAVALAFGGVTWWTYTAANPTSTDATLIHRDGDWFVEARFSPSEFTAIKIDTGAIVTSPDFPELRMTGLVSKKEPDDTVIVALDHGPPEDAVQQRSPAAVTLDAATAPQ